MITQALAQPLQILQALNNFQPSLLILSLDLKDIDGLMLAQAVQQHASFRDLPLALLSAQTTIGPRLAATGLSGETLLGKPPNPELLFTVIAEAATSRIGVIPQTQPAQSSGYGQRPA